MFEPNPDELAEDFLEAGYICDKVAYQIPGASRTNVIAPLDCDCPPRANPYLSRRSWAYENPSPAFLPESAPVHYPHFYSNPGDYEMGRLLSGKVRRKLKKGLKKATLGPLIIAHKITHGKKSPIRKLELKIQQGVAKAFPFTKPFIQVHNKLSEKVYGVMEKTGIAKKGETLYAHGIGEKGKGKLSAATVMAAASSAAGKSGGDTAALAARVKQARSLVPDVTPAKALATAQKLGLPVHDAAKLTTPAGRKVLAQASAATGQTVTLSGLLSRWGNQSALTALAR